MINWTCYNCGSYEVFESMFVRINRLACIIDDEEHLRVDEKKGHSKAALSCLMCTIRLLLGFFCFVLSFLILILFFGEGVPANAISCW